MIIPDSSGGWLKDQTTLRLQSEALWPGASQPDRAFFDKAILSKALSLLTPTSWLSTRTS